MLKKLLLFGCLSLLLLTLNAADVVKPDKWSYLPKVVAKVGTVNVSKQDFIGYLESNLEPRALANQDYVKKIGPELLDGYVNLVLLVKQAEKSGYKPSAAMAGKELKKLYSQISEAQLNKLKSSKSVQMEMARNVWIENVIKPKIKITDADIKKAYDDYSILIKAAHILYRPNGNSPAELRKARARADASLKKIKAGTPFEKIAATDNDCHASAKPGDLGEFGRGKMVQSFEDAAFKLEPGQISDVVQSPFGFHIIKVNGKRKVPLPPYDKVKEQLRQKLTSIRIEDVIIAILQKQKKAITVTIFLK
jgi:peptidyl-prolyl cis-trans isomerase C